MGGKANLEPIVSKIYCSQSKTVLTIRRRPHVVNGGGFVVTNCSQKVLFRVEGCGTLGTKNELILRDGAGDYLLLIRQKGGIIQALSVHRQWRGYMRNYEGAEKLVFSLKEPNSYFVKNITTVTVEPRRSNNKDWDFQIKGSFPDKACSIIDSRGNIVAQVGVLLEDHQVASNKDVYHVVVQPGFDQAFVIGVIAVLDNINDESTRC
ncbi:LURP1-like domain [Macleaya cordata]|uniref:LURP1-like domain n=1 Tax=Macleaya cordata TaxID=56857 RepID=A0A200PT46_MACCD|nr:LURP1-like domain [Macleaya cordata]